MIISRTPLRMSFVGGGSDLPEFYRRHGGAVVSTAIDKYVYVTVNRKFDSGIRVAYSKTEEVISVDAIEHPIVRGTMGLLGLTGGVEITTVADIPSRGTGLGSSSSFTVGLINALAAFQSRHMSNDELSSASCRVEMEICGEPIGKQDSYAAAFGGFNFIEFRPDESVLVSPIVLRPEIRENLQRRLIMLYTGVTRSAVGILAEQSANTAADPATRGTLMRMVQLAHVLRDDLQRGALDSFGAILHENWMLKRTLASTVSTSEIDSWYEAARAHGALGGKILGAGSGGFLMLYAEEQHHAAVKRALAPLRPVDFNFEPLGSRILFYNP
jgi:D-glycero-alpha-D-manno-heptose-7-phosphate kinase